MTRIDKLDDTPIRRLLNLTTPSRAADIEALLKELALEMELDRDTDRVLFQARCGSPNLIRVGLKCTVRLQVHAHAAAIVLTGLTSPGFTEMPNSERRKLFGPADKLLSWAVENDLRSWGILPAHDGDATLLKGGLLELPEEILHSLPIEAWRFGELLFRYACSWILLHELGHLVLGHRKCDGFASIQQEKEADAFAAAWMIDSAACVDQKKVKTERLWVLGGTAVALLWITVFNVYFGPRQASTHPESYDRLFQVLDQVLGEGDDDEQVFVWELVFKMLLIHMHAAGHNFDEYDAEQIQKGSRESVVQCINKISRLT